MTLEPAPFRVIPALLFALLLPAIHPAFAEDPPPLQDQPVPDITRFPATDTPATPPLPVPKPTTPPPAKIPGQLTIPASPDMPVMAAPSSLALLPDSALPPASAKHPQPPIWADDHADSAGQTVAPGNKAAVLFPSGSAALPDDAAQKLAPLRDLLKAFPNERLRLTAYASGAPDQPVEARRMALQRAIAVRALLMDQGIRSGRIDVHALGENAPDGPPDRVDVVLDSAARAIEKDKE